MIPVFLTYRIMCFFSRKKQTYQAMLAALISAILLSSYQSLALAAFLPFQNNIFHKQFVRRTLQESIASLTATTGTIGVNWGSYYITDPPSPQLVVEAILAYGFTSVKLFQTMDEEVSAALANTGLQVTVYFDPSEFTSVAGTASVDDAVGLFSTPDGLAAASEWVQTYVQSPRNEGVDVRIVCVGNEPDWANGNDADWLLMLANVQGALKALNLDSIVKATIPVRTEILSTSFPPSAGTFDSTISEIPSLLQLLNDTGTPFAVNLYPFFVGFDILAAGGTLSSSQIRLYTFQGTADDYLTDPLTGYIYTNMFDCQYDAVIAALKQAGFPAMEVIVTESGWPSSGSSLATPELAQAYNRNLVLHLWEGNGTPLRPNNGSAPTYIFELFDEPLKPVTDGAVEPFWGIATFSEGELTAKYNFSAEADGYLEESGQWSAPASEGHHSIQQMDMILLCFLCVFIFYCTWL